LRELRLYTPAPVRFIFGRLINRKLNQSYRTYTQANTSTAGNSQYHPDRYTSLPASERQNAEEMIKKINEAYDRLKKIMLVYRSMIDHVCYTVYTIDCSEKLFGEKE
jgi:hypothetical protein